MFSTDIVSSDPFLDMGQGAQVLYFHLAMRADDDGFVNPKSIMRMLGIADDELKVLLAKRFILPFESGVVVIKHWLVHNMIRADRYKETPYKKEKATLMLNESNAYTERTTGIGLKPVKSIEKPDWYVNRKEKLKESSLPSRFDEEIRKAFIGEECPICERKMESSDRFNRITNGGIDTRPSIQHNVPLSLGGKHELGNISVICQSCNASINNSETGILNSEKVTWMWTEKIGNQSATECKPSIGKDRIGKDREDTVDESFEEFWNLYPKRRKSGKTIPKEKWDKLTDSQKKLVMEDIRKRPLEHWDWIKQNNDFVPAPEVYLNAKKEYWLQPIVKQQENKQLAPVQKVDRFVKQ